MQATWPQELSLHCHRERSNPAYPWRTIPAIILISTSGQTKVWPILMGVFIGAASSRQHKDKNILILDKEPHRYQKFISDIAGQDIQSHDNLERNIIERVRTWLSNEARMGIPGGRHLADRYEQFKAELPALCDELRLEDKKLTFAEHATIVAGWAAKEPLGKVSSTVQRNF